MTTLVSHGDPGFVKRDERIDRLKFGLDPGRGIFEHRGRPVSVIQDVDTSPATS